MVPHIKHYLSDWICAAVLVVLFFVVGERAQPFSREFYLGDMLISHPYTSHERVLGQECIAISFFVPVLAIVAISVYRAKGFTRQCLNQLNVGLLALTLALALNGCITDALKCWISRPRPDFLDRCGPAKGTPKHTMVSIDVCTAPYGQNTLVDGMKLTPSGHSLIAFAGLGFLTLWLFGQQKLMQKQARIPLVFYMLAFVPVAISTYIALLRTQDYRHHFGDVCFGSFLGALVAALMYFRYYPALELEECDEPRPLEDISPVLPQ